MPEIHFEHCILRDTTRWPEFECTRCGKKEQLGFDYTRAAIDRAMKAFRAKHMACTAPQEAPDAA